jgi:hypothetical protein
VIGLALAAGDPNPHLVTNARIILDPLNVSGVHRGGILLHTGNWSSVSKWTPDQPMPNSNGCIHAHPDAIRRVWQLLVGLGVEVSLLESRASRRRRPGEPPSLDQQRLQPL